MDSQKSPLVLTASKPYRGATVGTQDDMTKAKMTNTLDAEIQRPQHNKTETAIYLCSDGDQMLENSDAEQEESKVSRTTVQEYNDVLNDMSKSTFYEGISRHEAKECLKRCLPNANLVPHVNDNQYEEKHVLYKA